MGHLLVGGRRGPMTNRHRSPGTVRLAILAAALGMLSAGDLPAQARVQAIHFRPGSTSTAIAGKVQGDQSVDYLLNARAGQKLSVSLTSSNRSVYFNLIAPGEKDVAFYVGSNSDELNRFQGSVPASGNTRVRVYLYRAAARRGEVATYRLNVSIKGSAKPNEPSGDALVAGTDFQATGNIDCTTPQGSSQCPFGVHREGAGSGWVQITRPNGAKRAIFFEHGKPVRFDASEADNAAFSVARKGDNSVVRIRNETYVIPDAVISGG